MGIRVTKLLTAPWRALKAALTSMRWTGAQRYWWQLGLPRTRFNYGAEIGDGSGSSIVQAVVGWIARNFPEAPLQAVEIQPDGTRRPIVGHRMTERIERPNAYYSGVLLWMATIVDWAVDGNGYWLKRRAPRSGDVAELWWAPASTMEPKWPDDGSVFISHYEYRPDPNKAAIPLEVADVVHFRRGLDPANTRKGISPLRSVMREIFTDEEAANFTASLMRNLGVPGVVIAPDQVGFSQSKEQALQVKADFMEKFGGDKRGEPMVMTAPTKVQVLSFSPEQMELRNLRRIPEERVSAIFGVAAIVAGLGAGLDRSTFTNFSEARESAYEENIIPTQRLLTADLRLQLLPDFETRATVDVQFDLSRVRVLQPDVDKVYERMNKAVLGGWAMVADARLAAGLPVAPEHYVYLRPMTSVEVPAGAPPAPAKARRARRKTRRQAMAALVALRNKYRPRIEAAAGGAVSAEISDVRAAGRRMLRAQGMTEWEAFVDSYYLARPDQVVEQMRPILTAYATDVAAMAAQVAGKTAPMPLEVFLAEYLAALGKRWTGSSRGQLLSVVGDAYRDGLDPIDALETRLGEWEATRAAKVGAWESVQAGNAVTQHTYQAAGVVEKVWMAEAGACPLCQELDGQTVSITEYFLGAGEELSADGARPLTTDLDVGHPPLHEGCGCLVMPV